MKAITILLLLCGSAWAWDGPALWYASATGGATGTLPGGGGIMGTGGQHDYGIKCTDCHVQRKDEPALAFAMTFSPALAGATYTPGQRYTVTAQLSGAQLGVPCTMQYSSNVDNFAASFEDDTGNQAGALTPDDGQSAPNCTLPSPPPAGTTALDGDCKVIFSNGTKDIDRWTFTWTAPTTGTVHVFWGAVDGDCDMMSMNDAAVTGSMTLTPATMRTVVAVPWPVEIVAEVLRWMVT
jgi:hypothetical protein